MKSLLIGCGNDRARKVSWYDRREWGELVTLDIDPSTGCDVVHDLNVLPLPFEDNSFDEIHAYEVLEHCGRQGDWRYFIDQFNDFYRVLKPGGFFAATVPSWDGEWAWGDPGHTRVITKGSLIYINRQEYAQIGKTSMTDYRPWLKCDFQIVAYTEEGTQTAFVLQVRK